MAASTYAPRARDTAMADMNVTPLVDVMLVMLVIFMITAPVLARPLPVNLPVPSPFDPPAPPVRAELKVDMNGAFQLDGQAIGADGLRTALAGLARRSPGAVLHIDTAGEADYQGFATALSAAQDSGIANIALGD